MEATVMTHFWTFDQNNSGGYFVTNKAAGVCEYIIIQAINQDHAIARLNEIGDKVSGFWSYCSCCGERWSWFFDEDDAKPEPMIYDTPIAEVKSQMFRKEVYVHYLDGRIVHHVFIEE